MEIIEIIDDVGLDDAVSISSGSDHSDLSTSSGLPFISISSSPQHQMSEDGHNSPKPHHAAEEIWDQKPPALALDALGDKRAANHGEPDWRIFLIDDDNDSTIADMAKSEYLPSLGVDQQHFNISVSRNASPSGFASPVIDAKQDCIDEVIAVFPHICRDYVVHLYDTGIGETAELLVAHILDKLDGGIEYPKAKDKLNTLKRKREMDEDEEAAKEYGKSDRENGSHDYATLTRTILSLEFSQTPMTFIDSTLNDSRHHLYPAYMILEGAERTYDHAKTPYTKIKKPRISGFRWTPERVDETINAEGATADMILVLRELQAARRAREKANDKRQAKRQAQLDEEENIKKAQAEGTMLECGCCFDDFPLNRMVHCEDELLPHWFCRLCAKQMAENEIGNSKHQIKCMSMDGCKFGFSRYMKIQFLDEKALIALDRNEQEEMLRLAGIENLESCPFCPFAAEYPPVEEDREFRCQAPDCERVSCRICKLESHIPKSCAEYAKDKGLSVRRQIEEAMSAALIRKCNKCGTSFVKEEGCNKMTCTRSGCYNVQCYVCSKSCSYDHFNDRSRGGKAGNCPLFDNVEERHHEEVGKAEKEALARVRAEHPEYTDEDLKVKVSEDVKRDEERRRSYDARNPIPGGVGHRAPAAGIFPHRVRVRPPVVPGPPVQRPVEARPLLRVFPEPPQWHHFDIGAGGQPAPPAFQQVGNPFLPGFGMFPDDFAPLVGAAGQRNERLTPAPALHFAEPAKLFPLIGFDGENDGMPGLDRLGQDLFGQDFRPKQIGTHDPMESRALGDNLRFFTPPLPAPFPVAVPAQEGNRMPEFIAYGEGQIINHERQDTQWKQQQHEQIQARLRANIRIQVQDQALREQQQRIDVNVRTLAQIRHRAREERSAQLQAPRARPLPRYPGAMALRIAPRP